ncbi:RecQ family ATP-dependent DNA helicase [Bacillus sp. B1-b2]|uniref:RecQ family ATP-dependent DNA helicase n=1 Tax=Bacillus sp. B1-b2 TaxID=2653201 RepID=UPI001261FD38|nr:RecQ family ATP-dependent DNA helicase [Bacillus sp. B1-b2]KAB7672904.1 ATP-dependent DNA helicase RecQ [Bacillus sp. B1-b2]
MNLEAILRKSFGLESFRIGQKETITSLISKQHTLTMLPTGTGKSLCYQFTGKLLDGSVIIISPLLSLMQDQVEQMKMKGEKNVIALNSFLTLNEKKHVLHTLHKYKFIFISPEMIVLPNVLFILRKMKIGLFVVDEAHCISQWGYDFRPDYQKLGEIRQKLNNPLTLALTATATDSIRKDIIQSLYLEEVNEIIYPVDRANITLKMKEISNANEKLPVLLNYIKQLKGQGIIYFSSKKVAEQVSSYLKERTEKRIMAYHGSMNQEDRILVQQQYLAGQLDIICATSAFGMGINKEDIRYIIHYHIPTKLESYLQEIGRAGRDGKQSVAILLYVSGDERIAYQLVESELSNELQIDQWKISLNQFSDYMQWLHANEHTIPNLFTETQWRVLRDFVKPDSKSIEEIHIELERFKRFRKVRIEEKKQKIQQLMDWISAKECRRKYIASYFEEVWISYETFCCDYCGFDLAFFAGDKEQPSATFSDMGWKEQLQEILGIKSR